MNNLEFGRNKQFDHLLFLGDTHGANMAIAHKLLSKTRIPREDKKAIVHVGDFGIGFCDTIEEEIAKLEKLDTSLLEHNVTLFVIRGNHDNPAWFNNSIKAFYQNTSCSNIVFVKDHTLLTLHVVDKPTGVRIYCNGGATSIDRKRRVDGKSYWKEEKFNKLSQKQLEELPTNLDIIVTHSRPLGVEPTVYNQAVMMYCQTDDQLDKDLQTEQADMKEMFDVLRARNSNHNVIHYFGHFHWSRAERIQNFCHRALAENELRMWHYKRIKSIL